MRDEIRQIQALMEGAAYITDPAISTAVYLATTLRQAAPGRGPRGGRQDRDRQGPGAGPRDEPDPPPVLRGARRLDGALRVELPEADPPDPARGAGRAGGGGEGGGHLLGDLPAQAPAAPGHHPAGAGARPPHRRDRPGRHRVRELPPGGAVRLPGDGPGDRDDHGRPPPRRRADVEPLARPLGRPPAPVPVPLDRLPVLREGGAHPPDEGARASTSGWPARSRASCRTSGAGSSRRCREWPRASTGRRRSSPSTPTTSTPRLVRETLGCVLKEVDDVKRVEADLAAGRLSELLEG